MRSFENEARIIVLAHLVVHGRESAADGYGVLYG